MVDSRFARCFYATCKFSEISRFVGVDFGVLFNFLCVFLAGFVALIAEFLGFLCEFTRWFLLRNFLA